MRFLTFSLLGELRLGVLGKNQAVVDLTTSAASQLPDQLRSEVQALSSLLGFSPFSSMLAYLVAWNSARNRATECVTQLISLISERGGPELLSLGDLAVRAPLPNPSSLRDGYAFRQHVETMRRNRGAEMIPEFDHFPVFYFGNHQAIFGPGDFPVQALQLDRLDYELEVAVVIGRGGMNIKASEADSHIFGLTIMNDMSARALQTEEMKLSLGPAKGKDFGTILGPQIVTLEELAPNTTKTPQGNRYDLEMKASVNGKLLSQGNLKAMNWTFAQIVERASYGAMLYPGDVIGSGTVGTGCLAELNSSKITDNLWLKPGDVVSLEVAQLGVLENRIVQVEDSFREVQ